MYVFSDFVKNQFMSVDQFLGIYCIGQCIFPKYQYHAVSEPISLLDVLKSGIVMPSTLFILFYYFSFGIALSILDLL
jgi:ABC-type multidrug transport system permease subunit